MGTVAIHVAILYMTLVMLALGCVHATMPADNINGSPRGTTPRNNHARAFEGGACAPDALPLYPCASARSKRKFQLCNPVEVVAIQCKELGNT